MIQINYKKIFFAFLSFVCAFTFSTCSYTTFSGTLLKKPWSKSTQSYCAQGSDYYILKNGEQEYVVKFKTEKTLDELNEQLVIIEGELEEIRIEPPATDIPSQVPDMGPAGAAFTCTVLKAKRIKKSSK